MTPSRRPAVEWTLASALLLALGVAYAWPLPKALSTTVPGDQRDPLLNAALLDHVFRSLATLRWGAVWDAPFFFPYRNTLAFSESFLGTAWYGIPLWLLTPDPVALHNAFHVAGLFLSSLAATVLGAALTGEVALGLVAGVVVGLAFAVVSRGRPARHAIVQLASGAAAAAIVGGSWAIALR